MTKINQKPLPASLQLTDEMPLNRSGADFRGNFQKVLDLMIAQGLLDEDAAIAAGFLIGDPSAIYAANSSTGAKWQLDQVPLEVYGSGGETINLDCSQKNRFYLQVDSGGCELDEPANVPATGNGWFYFQIHALSSNIDPLTFSNNMVRMYGSCQYDILGENVIHCWKNPGYTYYYIQNTLGPEGAVQTFDVTIPSAEVLTSYTAPVEIVPAPPAGKFISPERVYACLVDGDTPYGTNMSGIVTLGSFNVFIEIDLAEDQNNVRFTNGNVSPGFISNSNITYLTLNGNPEGGNYDIRVWGSYRILDI